MNFSATEKPLVSIIILNWNGASLLTECIESVLTTSYKPIEIIVVDNASEDNSCELLHNYSSVKLVRNSLNLGYAGGNNVGFSFAQGKYFVTLNNDIVVEPTWLDEAVDLLQSDEKIGIISCRQMNYYRRNIIDTLFSHLASYLLLQPTYQGEIFGSRSIHSTTGLVLGANGASAIYRRKLIEELGGFDNRFFAYQEECDLHIRAFLCGWKCVYVPSAVVYHKGSATFNKIKPIFYYYHERNRLWFIYRNMPLTFIIRNVGIVALREVRTMVNMVFVKKMPLVYLRARLDGFRGMAQFRGIRAKNMRLFLKKQSEFNLLYKLRHLRIQ